MSTIYNFDDLNAMVEQLTHQAVTVLKLFGKTHCRDYYTVAEEILNYFEKLVSEESENIKSQVDAYFRNQSLTLGMMVQYLSDCTTAPHAAIELLNMLHEDGYITTPLCRDDFAQLPPDNLNVEPQWNVASDTHAYPGMTWKKFRDKQYNILRSNKVHRDAVFAAYGLTNPLMIKDLIGLASGDMRKLANCKPGSLVPDYIVEYRENFPCVSAMFEHCFSCVSLTITPVEQAFSVVSSRGSKAKDMTTKSNNLQLLAM
jgi:hypothetical protein